MSSYAMFPIMAAVVSAQRIKDIGIWSGLDVFDEDTQISVINGIVGSPDADVERRIRAGMTTSYIEDYLNHENVKIVQSILSEEKFNETFFHRNEVYTYDGLL